MKTPIAFKRAALVEGFSLLTLLFIAMPVKYLAHEPLLVKIVGPLHGIAFLSYEYLLLRFTVELDWGAKKAALLSLAAFIPGGTFMAIRR